MVRINDVLGFWVLCSGIGKNGFFKVKTISHHISSMGVEQRLGDSNLSFRHSGYRDLSLRGPGVSQAFENASVHETRSPRFTKLLDRNILKGQCSVYGPQLLYTLRPGSCSFSNRELKYRYRSMNWDSDKQRQWMARHELLCWAILTRSDGELRIMRPLRHG